MTTTTGDVPRAPKPDRLAVARALWQIAQLLRIKNDSPFRARAYERGAEALESFPGDLGALVAADRLTLNVNKIRTLQDALGVDSLAALEAACREGRVRAVRGFGAKTEERLLEDLRRLREGEGTALLHRALQVGERLLRHLRGSKAIDRVELAGELRRRHETVSKLEVVATGSSAKLAMARSRRRYAASYPRTS